jgi:flagellar M-ring protein FliF
VASQDILGQLRNSLRRFNEGFTTGQKAVVAVGIALVVVLAIAVSSFASKPTYGVLFANLSPTDAGQIASKLSAANVPYELMNGGTTIMVPENLVDQERIAMAEAGLPASSTDGLSILSKVGITTSQITQQADYQAALQGQLEQTIEAINGVSSAQVNLALPPTDVFAVGGNQAPSASVIVSLDPGVSLSPTQVQAIVHLVASAIPGMSASNVTVVDQNGDVLAAPGLASSGASTTGETQNYDAALEASLQSMLDSVLGPGNSNVRVAATLDYNQVTTNSQTVATNPNGKPNTAVTQNQTQTQTFTGTGGLPTGTLGTVGQAAVGTQNGNYKQSSTTTNYAVGSVKQQVIQPPGQLQRLSVAVAVNSKVKGVNIAQIKQMVSAAAGVVPKRGDVVSVVKVPFAATAAKLTPSTFTTSSILGLAKIVLLVVGIIVAVWLMARSSASTEIEELDIPELAPQLALAPSAAATAELPKAISIPDVHPVVADDVLDFIDRQPEDVAKLLRIWMTSRGKR